MASTNNNLPQNDHGSKEPRDDAEITLQACKTCGEIGHISKECHEQCPYYDTSHPIEKCTMTQFTCSYAMESIMFLLNVTFTPTVQWMNQQAKDGRCQLLGKTPKDRRPKMKVEKKVMETTHNLTTKYCFSCEEEWHLSRNCSRKQERFPTTIVEYGEKEVRDLLALERPKNKNDNSKVLRLNCKELGHYAKKCAERNNKVNRQRGTNLVTSSKCNWKGHYAGKCAENGT
jgi:hypothetical protein